MLQSITPSTGNKIVNLKTNVVQSTTICTDSTVSCSNDERFVNRPESPEATQYFFRQSVRQGKNPRSAATRVPQPISTVPSYSDSIPTSPHTKTNKKTIDTQTLGGHRFNNNIVISLRKTIAGT